MAPFLCPFPFSRGIWATKKVVVFHMRTLPFSFAYTRTLSALLLIIWMGVIFSFSALSGQVPDSPPPFSYFLERKGAHVFEYALLTWISFCFFRYTFVHDGWKKILLVAAFFSLAYGATDELHQFFVPFRGARFTDVLIDGGGVLLAALLISSWRKWRER